MSYLSDIANTCFKQNAQATPASTYAGSKADQYRLAQAALTSYFAYEYTPKLKNKDWFIKHLPMLDKDELSNIYDEYRKNKSVLRASSPIFSVYLFKKLEEKLSTEEKSPDNFRKNALNSVLFHIARMHAHGRMLTKGIGKSDKQRKHLQHSLKSAEDALKPYTQDIMSLDAYSSDKKIALVVDSFLQSDLIRELSFPFATFTVPDDIQAYAGWKNAAKDITAIRSAKPTL